MVDVGIVQGSKEQAIPLIIGKDTVYVHTDIQEITVEDMGRQYTIWRYHEIQYDKDEYLKLLVEREVKTRVDVEYISIMSGIDLEV